MTRVTFSGASPPTATVGLQLVVGQQLFVVQQVAVGQQLFVVQQLVVGRQLLVVQQLVVGQQSLPYPVLHGSDAPSKSPAPVGVQGVTGLRCGMCRHGAESSVLVYRPIKGAQ